MIDVKETVPPGLRLGQDAKVMGKIEMGELIKYTRLLEATLRLYQAAILELQQKVTALES